MGNPIITQIGAGANYSVSDSTRVHATLALTMLAEEATFDVTFPTTAAPTVSLQGPAGTVALTVPAAIEQTDSSIPSRVVYWQTYDVATTRTLHVRVEDTTLMTVDEPWTIKVSALPSAVAATVVAGANTTISLVEADPIVEILTPSQNKKENQSATLQGRTRRNTLPPPSGAGCAGVAMSWTQTPGDAVTAMPGTTGSVATVFPGGAPGCQGEATVNLPGLTSSVVLHYTFSVTIGELGNTGSAVVNGSTRTRYTVLVLDRSGSMSGDKWDNTVTTAHIWTDLLIAFRSDNGGSDKLGLLVFEDNACTWRAAGAPDPAVEIVFPSLGALGAYPALSSLSGSAALNLGAPGSCTPIGDALIRALDRMVGLSSTPAEDLYGIMLLTDGKENSGTVRVDKEPPPPMTAGVEVFQSIRGIGARSIFQFTGPAHNVRFYATGVGPLGGVQEDVLDDLAYGDVSLGSGYYRLVTDVKDLVPALGQMLSHYIGAQAQTVTPSAPNPSFPDPAPNPGKTAYFVVPANEKKLVVVLLWNSLTDEMDLRWRHQGVTGEAFVVPPAGSIDVYKREKHGTAVIDLTSGGINATGTEWRIQYKPGGGAVAAMDTGKVLAARDLSVRTEILFDRDSYRTGRPMKIEARLGAGGAPITGAQVTVELARPGESLGTFLSVNSRQYQLTSFPKLSMTSAGGTGHAAGSGDPPRPKQVLLDHLLKLKDMMELPMVSPPSIFTDGTDKLHDDGTHGDGEADDGRYANTFAHTDMEGTYTFRFRISGEAPDGSRFDDTFTLSRWVGVNVDPLRSVVTMELLPPTEDTRFQTARIFVTPKDRNGQYLGPFRATEIQLGATAGVFQGELESLPDGRYVRTLLYKPGELPTVTVTVQGKPFPPIAVAPGCLGWFVKLFHALVKWVLRLIFYKP